MYFSLVTPLITGVQLYNDNGCTIIATGGDDLFYKSQEQLQTMQINTSGVVIEIQSCP